MKSESMSKNSSAGTDLASTTPLAQNSVLSPQGPQQSREERKNEKASTMNKSYTSTQLTGFHFLCNLQSGEDFWALLPKELSTQAQYLNHYPLYLPHFSNTSHEGGGPLADRLKSNIPLQDDKENQEQTYTPLITSILKEFEVEVRDKGLIAGEENLFQKVEKSCLSVHGEADEVQKKSFTEFLQTFKEDSLQGNFLGLDGNTNIHLALQSLLREKLSALNEFTGHLQSVNSRLNEVVKMLEQRKGEPGSTPLKQSLGGLGGLINTDKLASVLPAYKGSQKMSDKRLEALQKASHTLGEFLQNQKSLANLNVYLSPEKKAPEVHSENFKFKSTPTPLSDANRDFALESQAFLNVVRALRLAEIELEGHYDADLHDDYLKGLGWESLSASEKTAGPTFLVWDNLNHTLEAEMSALINTLHSSLPIKMSLEFTPFSFPSANKERSPADLINKSTSTLLLALSARESLILGGTLANPEQLLEGYREFSKTTRTACALICIPENEKSHPQSWPQLNLAWACRISPCVIFNPEKGDSWADTFDFSGNLQAEKDWPLLSNQEEGKSADPSLTQTTALTWAQLCTLNTVMRKHLLVINEDSHYENQCELSEYLEKHPQPNPAHIPYIYVSKTEGENRRAIVSQELVLSCRKITKSWKQLQELAGIHNKYAIYASEKSAQAAKEEYTQETQKLVQRHKEELELIRKTEAQRVIEKLTRGMLQVGSGEGPGVIPLMSGGQPPTGRPLAPDSQATGISEAAAPAEAEGPVENLSEESYVESELCTSCNDCTNINNRMFKYNEDKQVYLADESAGTFAQLVKAALKCPAKCIHPGSPRPDDSTATPELIKKVASL